MQFKDYPMPSKGGSDGPTGSTFLKIADGESKRGVFRGEIYEFFSKWEGGKSLVCEPNEPGAKRRFKINFITEENGGLVAKVWECGILVYQQLKDINDEYPLDETKVKVTRSGTGKDTSYMILPLLSAKEKLTPKQLDKIQSIDLVVLNKQKAEPAPPPTDGPDWPEDEKTGSYF